ncbi:MAG TPA: hypothetical protein VLJ88_05155, partial [Propionibacteriaceae bacterium]|nr:hypothetical protein [Propionibacteriaceae bacterium]
MPAQSYLTARPSRLAARLLVLAVALSFLVVRPAAAAEPPVMIDNFAGAVLGTRTVTGLPSPGQATTPPGTFSQAGGVGRIQATGNGTRPGGVQLDYAFPSTDLRAGDANTRLLVEFAAIDRQPEPPAPQGAVLVAITVGDANGGSSSHSSVLDNSGNVDLALNLDCGARSTDCLSGNADFA